MKSTRPSAPAPASHPRRERAEDTRTRLVAAAMKVFARYGYRQASMEAVAQEVQLSRQSVYNHFPNKDVMFIAAVAALQQIGHASAVAAAGQSRAAGADVVGELVAALVARVVVYTQALQGTPHVGELLDEQGRLCGEVVAQGNAEFRAMLLRRAQAHRSAGTLVLPRRVSTAEFVDDVLLVALGLKHQEASADAATLEARLERILRRLLAGLQAGAGISAPPPRRARR